MTATFLHALAKAWKENQPHDYTLSGVAAYDQNEPVESSNAGRPPRNSEWVLPLS
jgi:hypothetical protein